MRNPLFTKFWAGSLTGDAAKINFRGQLAHETAQYLKNRLNNQPIWGKKAEQCSVE